MILVAAVHYGYSIRKYDPLSLNLSSGVSEQTNERSRVREQSLLCVAIKQSEQCERLSKRASGRAQHSTRRFQANSTQSAGWRTSGVSGRGNGGGA